MKKSFQVLVFLLVLVAALFALAACASAPTPVPPTVAPKPTEAPKATSAPTVAPTTAPTVAPTAAAKPTEAPKVTTAPTTAPIVAPTTAPTVAPTKAAAAGPATLAPIKETPTLIATAPKTADDLQVISPELLKAMIEGGADIVVVDVQPKEAYALGHIKGAVNLPWDMKIKGAGGLPMNKLLVVYCACEPNAKSSETDAGDVAMQLISNFGYKKIALLDGGLLRWQQLKYPAEPATK